jgi:AI-2 transport protein TqsA
MNPKGRPPQHSLSPPEAPPGRQAGRWTWGLGALVLLGFVLVQLKPILVPIFLALLLAVVLTPLVDWLVKRRIGTPFAILIAETAAMLPVLGFILAIVATAGPLSDALPKYRAQLTQQARNIVEEVIALAPADERGELRQQLSDGLIPEALAEGAELIQSSLRTVGTLFGYFFLTLLITGFVLHEGRRFREKFAAAFGAHNPLTDALESIGRDVRAYVVAKAFISFLTGLLVWGFLEVCQVDFALFWGLLAFPLNFIPTVGAIIASLPPIVLAIIDPEMGAWSAAGVGIGLIAINGTIGSVLDPRYVGLRVKLSPLVVLLSMLLWGTLWGPIGMILAVPIMVSVKLVCERIPSLAPVATMMRG